MTLLNMASYGRHSSSWFIDVAERTRAFPEAQGAAAEAYQDKKWELHIDDSDVISMWQTTYSDDQEKLCTLVHVQYN